MANFNFNKVILGGRVTADIELKQTASGMSVCNFNLAVNRKGSQPQASDFIECVAWGKTADFISQYFKKGSSICVIGRIQVRSWTDNNNNKRKTTEVVVEEANFVDSKSDEKPAQSNEPKWEEVEVDSDLPF